MWRQKYTKYNKINNNSKNFRGGKLLLGFSPLVVGLIGAERTYGQSEPKVL